MSLLDGLRAYWKLDEASGNAVDAHGSFTLTDSNTADGVTGKINNGRRIRFSGFSESLIRSSSADLSPGDVDFAIGFWVNFTAFNSFSMPVSKFNGSQDEYTFYYNSGTSRLNFQVQSAGGTTGIATANTHGALSTGTWYHVVGWHDSVNNQVGIAINAGTPDTAAHSAGVRSGGSARFRIGVSDSEATNQWCDCVVDEVGFWDRVLTSQERTDLYFGGNGLAYEDFGGGGGPATSGDAVLRGLGRLSVAGFKASSTSLTMRAGARLGATGAKAASGAATIAVQAEAVTVGSKASAHAADQRAPARLSAVGASARQASAALRASGILVATQAGAVPATSGSAAFRALVTLTSSAMKASTSQAALAASGRLRATGVRASAGTAVATAYGRMALATGIASRSGTAALWARGFGIAVAGVTQAPGIVGVTAVPVAAVGVTALATAALGITVVPEGA